MKVCIYDISDALNEIVDCTYCTIAILRLENKTLISSLSRRKTLTLTGVVKEKHGKVWQVSERDKS